jgi:Fe-S-cluster-containing dehydrogenase component/formate-dependent nitrite reductase membrane component NrfD
LSQHAEAPATTLSGFQPGNGAPDLVQWAKVIDHTRCIACHACTVACKSENEVPLSVTRTYVKHVEVGTFPRVRRAYQVTRCNQCADAPCVTACPTSAMFQRPDGIVDFDKAACIGCKACIAACPYDAIFMNPEDHSAEKCNFCAHRIDMGLEPACVVVCPTEAIVVGDLNDPDSRVSRLVHGEAVQVRRPEKDTRPTLFYRGAHEATLDPIASRRPDGNLFASSGRQKVKHEVPPGDPNAHAPWNSSAAALLTYDVAHRAPWDFRVSLYTWTKGIAAGVYLTAIGLLLWGLVGWTDPLWVLGVPVVAGAFLALTALLLVWDLEHPRRFLYIFLRPQWRSWLVRGGVILTLYGLLLGVHFVAGVVDRWDLIRHLAWGGAPLAVLTAVYTAYLFAQARARDLWQNPLLPAHFLVRAALAGSASLVLLGAAAGWASPGFWTQPQATAASILVGTDRGVELAGPLLLAVAVASAVHLLMVLGEVTLTHSTAHARVATAQMVRGRWALHFWAGALLVAGGVAAPWLGIWAAAAPRGGGGGGA